MNGNSTYISLMLFGKENNTRYDTVWEMNMIRQEEEL